MTLGSAIHRRSDQPSSHLAMEDLSIGAFLTSKELGKVRLWHGADLSRTSVVLK
jgi:hypothetical protein